MSTLVAIARRTAGALILLAVVAIAVPVSAQAQTPPPASQQQAPVIDPDARAVNEQALLRELGRIQGSILIPDTRESVLIQPAGRLWDYFHEFLLRRIGVVVIFGMLVVLAIGYFVLGRLRISAGRSGTRVPRFNAFERFSHWLTATSFVVLALTGLNITFGKVVLRPLIGPDAFSLIAQYAKYTHNYVSFAFVLGLVLIVTMWIKDNIRARSTSPGSGRRRLHCLKHPPPDASMPAKAVFWFVLGAGARWPSPVIC